MSVAAFSQISQEDYDKLPSDTRTQIEKITTEKAIKGEIKEVSEYANLGKEIGVAVNETLKAVEDSAIRIQPRTNSNNYRSVETPLLGISVFMLLTGRLSKNDEDAGGWISVVGGAVFFISSMIWLRSYRLVYSSYILCNIASWYDFWLVIRLAFGRVAESGLLQRS